MAKYTLNRRQLKEHIQSVIAEAIDAYGMSGDYENDMQNLADKTGETLDDDFLDSVAGYDGRNGDGGPVYPDRKAEEMNADWRDIDDQAKDSQAKYGYNADELDKLNAFNDTIDQYINDINYNGYENAGYDVLGSEYDAAEAERQNQMESMLRKVIREAITEMSDSYNHPEQSNGNQFAGNYGTDAHKFSHGGVDAYHARKDQDKMHNKEKNNMRRADKRAMAAADKRPLHRKGSLNRAFDESKRQMRESTGQYLFHCYIEGQGNESMLVDDLNQIKPYIQKAKSWDITKGWNATDPNNLIAWGGEGGYWYDFLNKPEWAKEGVHWNKPSERERQLVLSKRKEFKPASETFESKIRKTIREALTEISDDDAFWKQQQKDELDYDMREFTKAMQQANGTYHAKSSDGKWQTGDRVIVHGRTKNIEGTIKDFGENIMTWKEDCDVDFEENGQIKTLLGVPLDRLEKISANEGKIHEEIDTGQVHSSQDNEDSKRHRLKRDEANKEINRQIRKLRQQISDYDSNGKDTTPLTNKIKSLKKQLKEAWYPEDEDDISDYYYGSIMKLDVDGVFDELTPEQVQELSAIHDEYIDNSDKYTSVMVRKINLIPDGFDGYDVSVEVAVSAPDMPTDEIENETQELVWYWIEEKLGVRSPNIHIVDEKVVFDRRTKYANQ